MKLYSDILSCGYSKSLAKLICASVLLSREDGFLYSAIRLCKVCLFYAEIRKLAKESSCSLGGICKGFGQLLADAQLQVYVLPSELTADEGNRLSSCHSDRPVVLKGALPHALDDHASHEGRDQLVQVQLQIDVWTVQHALGNLRVWESRL